jgi:acetyl-CoA C-acetyltransferase
VARRVGADPAYAILDVAGGQSPQALVTELAGAIAAGQREVVLVTGAEAISTVRHLGGRDDRPDFSETVGGQLEDRGIGLRGLVFWQTVIHGLLQAPEQYAMFENARRARTSLSREEYAESMGELFAPFSRVAAANPLSAAPTELSAHELVTPTARNRPIVDPYPRFLVARDQVNQGAAVLLTSAAAARRLGIPEERWVFLRGHVDLRNRDLFDRQDLSRHPVAGLAVRHALEVADATLDEVTAFDLYSCFPVAVSSVLDELDLAPDDPRGLTLTGGLPFFGGAGNNYSMHAIAEAVPRCRADADAVVLVAANGGMLSKCSIGVYAAEPAPWRPDRSAEIQAEIAAWPAPAFEPHPEGWATVETYTVQYGRDGHGPAIVIARLDDGGARVMANPIEDDEETFELLASADPVGSRVYVRAFADRNRVATSLERMDALRPRDSDPDWSDYDRRAVEFEAIL